MSDFLIGGQPELKEDFASMLEGSVGEDLGGTVEGLSSPFQRQATQAQVRSLGFDPSLLGTESAEQSFLGERAEELVASPGSQTANLFEALQPFEQEQMEEAVAGIRASFGNLGGRFGSEVQEAEAETRGELSNQFQRARAEQLLAARDRQLQGMATLLQNIGRARSQGFRESFAPFHTAARFAQSQQRRQGILPGLLQAGTNLFALSQQPDWGEIMGQDQIQIPDAPSGGGFGVEGPPAPDPFTDPTIDQPDLQPNMNQFAFNPSILGRGFKGVS